MAETQRVFRPSAPPLRPAPKPRPRHPVSYAAPLQLPLDETQDLRPPEPVAEPEAVRENLLEAPEKRPVAKRRERRAPSPLTPAEQMLMMVLVLGLSLTAAVLLLDPTLTRADIFLGSTVLLAGVVLLTFLEICRRGGPARR